MIRIRERPEHSRVQIPQIQLIYSRAQKEKLIKLKSKFKENNGIVRLSWSDYFLMTAEIADLKD